MAEKLVKVEALINALGSETAKAGDILEVTEESAKLLVEKGFAKKSAKK